MNRGRLTHPHLPDLHAHELETVLALAGYGSFVAASAFLEISQPAMTRALQRVEAKLGVTLFARTTRRVEITPAGREFVAVAERVLHDLEMAVRNVREVGGEQRGQVIVATYSAFACQEFPAILQRYRMTRPHIDVRLREGRQPDITDDVRTGVADFGVGFIDAIPETLACTMLRREPLVVMMPAAHPLAVRKVRRVTLASVQSESFVSVPGDSLTRRLIDGAAARAGFALNQRLVVTRFESVVRYVRAGAGLGIIPAGAIPPPPWDDFHAAPLAAPAMAVTLGVITRPGRYMPPAAAGLVALIHEQVHRRPGRR